MAAPTQTLLHRTFKEIRFHTAKCDVCNKHNEQYIYRCQGCGQQCCTPCWNKKGGDGKHVLNNDPANGPQSIIIKEADVQQSRAHRRKKKTTRNRRARGRLLEGFLDEQNGNANKSDDVLETGSSTVNPSRRTRTSSNINSLDDDADDSANSFEALFGKQSSGRAREPRPRTNAAEECENGSDPVDTLSNASPSMETSRRSSKRKSITISDDENIAEKYADYAWAFKHVAEEGRKRVKTSSSSGTTGRSGSLPQNEPVRDQAETVEYANYLIALSRGGLAQGPNSGSPNGEAHGRKKHQAKDAPSNSALSPSSASPASSTIAQQTKASAESGPAYHQSKAGSVAITNDNKMTTDQPDMTTANGKSSHHGNPQVNPTKEPLKVSFASSANGNAEMVEIDLSAGNNFRLSKPASFGDDAATPPNIDSTVEKSAVSDLSSQGMC